MSFINEYIPELDIKKFGIDEIDNRFIVGGTHSPQWTIDRNSNIYLRCVSRGREEISHRSTWTFYWNGELLVIILVLIGGEGNRGEPGWSHWKIRQIDIPQYLECQREDILSDLKEALTAYKDGGVFSANTTYSVILDV